MAVGYPLHFGTLETNTIWFRNKKHQKPPCSKASDVENLHNVSTWTGKVVTIVMLVFAYAHILFIWCTDIVRFGWNIISSLVLGVILVSMLLSMFVLVWLAKQFGVGRFLHFGYPDCCNTDNANIS